MSFHENIPEGMIPIEGALAGAMLVIAIIVALAAWVYTSFAWMTIARKLKQETPGLMWIPIVRTARIFQLGGKIHWAWIFLILVPLFGWLTIFILAIISEWEIFEQRKYPGALALIPIGRAIPFVSWIANIVWFIVLGFVAWKDQPNKKKR